MLHSEFNCLLVPAVDGCTTIGSCQSADNCEFVKLMLIKSTALPL